MIRESRRMPVRGKTEDIDRDIDGGRPGADQEELSFKICHQLLRLQNMTRGYHTRIEHDRDSIKKLITEIAHQLRTPLTNIETYLDFLRDEQDGGRRAQYLEAAKRSERKICFLRFAAPSCRRKKKRRRKGLTSAPVSRSGSDTGMTRTGFQKRCIIFWIMR